MKAKIKHNPRRINIPKYGNGLMLCMEFLSNFDSPIVGKIILLETSFDIQLLINEEHTQDLKKYINNNL